jgi:type IV secretory pathway VirD2 relaxase
VPIILGDLKRFTRDQIGQMEKDLVAGLDWIAGDHHNSNHSDTHMTVGGVADNEVEAERQRGASRTDAV